MNKNYGPHNSEFEAKWNELGDEQKQRTMIIVVVSGLILIASIVYISDRRHHDAFVDPLIKLQVPKVSQN